MNRIVCGMIVDDQLYEEYQNKKYEVGLEAKPLQTVEIIASSKDYDQFPELKAKAQRVVEQVQKEIKEYYAAKDGREEYIVMKHDTFDGYLRDLQDIHAKAAPERMQLKEKMDQARKRWEENQREFKDDEHYLAREKVRYLDAQEEYKNGIWALQQRTKEEIKAVQDEYEKHVADFYAANGNRLDDAAVRLLNSGIKLTDAEIDGMVGKSRSNPTMLRLISDHCDKQGIGNKSARIFGSLARKNGADEREAFKVVADMVKKAVSENETTSGIWAAEDSHFKRLSDQQIGAMGQLPVRPEETKAVE